MRLISDRLEFSIMIQAKIYFALALSIFILLPENLSFAQEGTSGGGTAGAARAMNPDIGANFLTWYRRNTSHTNQGFAIQEAEFAFKSDVDPYLTANAIFSVSPTDADPKAYKIGPEEIYVDTTFIPALTIRAGKFYGFFGKQNGYHTHAFPFIDVPLINATLLGDGFNDSGISVSYLIPTNFFSELTVQGFGDFKTLGHLRTLLETSDDSTLELGVSSVTQWAYGADVTYKHRPTDRGQGRRFNLAFEWMSGQLQGYTPAVPADGKPTRGYTAYTQYEFLPRIYAQYRFEEVISSKLNRNGILLAYAPSEFSAFRIQGDYSNNGSPIHEKRILAQMNITIGFHPPHDY